MKVGMKILLLFFLVAGMVGAADSSIVTGMNAFTAATYKNVAQGSGNLILSPFNIATALSMVLEGARGATANQIAATLHQHYGDSYDAALAALQSELAKAGNGDGNQLLMANRVWVQRGFPIQAAFEKALADNYHAPLTPLDFAGSAGAARETINRWTAEHTKDRIKEIIGPGSLNRDSRMVLTSAIYFYGKWQAPFLTSRTEPGSFQTAAGAKTDAKFMNQTARFNYAENAASQILEMPYARTGIAFDVILPKSRDGLAAMEKSLTPENLTGWLGHLSDRKVQVIFPKFRAEAEFSLRSTLSAMGMPAAFSDAADFSGINSSSQLRISDVVHKAFVDVAEEGTEAAAATGTHVVMAAARMPEQPVVFRADHPFLFVIRDTRSGIILFIGRLTAPKA